MRYHHYFLIVLSIMGHAFLYSANYIGLRDRREYQELESTFGKQGLEIALNYCQPKNSFCMVEYLQNWNVIAKQVIGTDNHKEEQRWLFLASVLLHNKNHHEGLQTLDACFDASHTKNPESKHNTPNGPIYMQIHDNQYQEAMKVSSSIRNTMFGEGGNKVNPLVLVDKVDSRMSIALKWALFRGAAVLAAIISSTRNENKDEKSKDRKTNENIGKALEGAWHIADLFRAIEEYAKNDLEIQYPILKTHEVKSLIDEEIWWLYDRKNWIMIGSATVMILLLAALMHDKLPYLYRQYSVIIIT